MYLIITHTKIYKAARLSAWDAQQAAIHGHRVIHVPNVDHRTEVHEVVPYLTSTKTEEITYRPSLHRADTSNWPTHTTPDGSEKVNY